MSDLLAVGLPVALAVGSGLAIVAYKHPKEFAKLHNGLRIVLIGVWLSVMSFGMGMSYAVKNSGVDQKVVEQMTTNLSGADQVVFTIWGGLLALWIYLEFLGCLPLLGIVAVNEKTSQK